MNQQRVGRQYQLPQCVRPCQVRIINPHRTVWTNRGFIALWSGESVSLLGSEVTVLALPLTAIIMLHASAFQVALLSGSAWLPYLGSMVVGVWVDQMRRRPLLVAANVGRAALLLLIPVAQVSQHLSLTLLYIVALCCGALTVVFNLAYGSYLPSIVPSAQLVAGNSALQASASVAKVSGPSVAGVVIQLVSAPIAVLVDACSFLIATTSLLTIRTPESLPHAHGARLPLYTAVKEGLYITFAQPWLRAMVGMGMIYNVFEEMVLALWTVYAIRELHLVPVQVGGVMAVGSIGAIVGSITAGHVAVRIGLGTAWLITTIVSSSALVLLPLASGRLLIPFLVLSFGINGYGQAGVNIYIKSIRQQIIPSSLRGRVTASYTLFSLGMIPVGSVIAAVLQSVIGIRATLFCAACGALFAIPCVWPLRHRVVAWEQSAASMTVVGVD